MKSSVSLMTSIIVATWTHRLVLPNGLLLLGTPFLITLVRRPILLVLVAYTMCCIMWSIQNIIMKTSYARVSIMHNTQNSRIWFSVPIYLMLHPHNVHKSFFSQCYEQFFLNRNRCDVDISAEWHYDSVTSAGLWKISPISNGHQLEWVVY